MKITSAPRVVRTIAALMLAILAGALQSVRAQGWTNVDVGSVSAAGSFAWGSTEYTVRGSGADIWGNTDEFHYVYYGWTGDGTFTVRVTGMTNTHTWAKAGIMLRENLTPGSRHVMVAANPANAAGFFWRTTPDAATDFRLAIYEIPQMWLRLVRSGNTFTGFQSADGNTWYQMGAPVTVALPLTVHAGFAVTSHADGVLCSATLANYNFVGTAAYPTPPVAPTGLTATATSPTTVSLRWTDNSNNESDFTVARSIDGTTYYHLAGLPPNTTTYTDSTASAGTTYRYRVDAFAGGVGSNSNVATVTTPGGATTLPAPSGLTATPYSSAQIILDWASYSPGTARMEIERARSGGPFVQVGTTDAVFSRHWDGTLDADTSYQYRIRAVNTSTGEASGYSAVAAATTLPLPAPINLRLSAMSSTELSAAWDYPPDRYYEVTMSHVERSTDGVVFTEIAQVGQSSVNRYADRVLSPATRYYYRVRGSRVNSFTGGRDYSAYSSVVSGTTQTAPPPPEGTFASADIGAVGAAGSATVSNGVFTVRGAGEDVYGVSDEFHYYYRQWTGDGVFIVRVTNVEFTFNWAKAGIMIRSALTDNAQHAYAFISPEQNHDLVYRTTAGGSTTGPLPVDFRQKAMPMWLRLTRAGSSVAMDYSFDGVNWVRRASTTIAFPDTVYVGLAVNSHVDAQLCTATFDNFTVEPVHPTAVRPIARSATSVYVTWQDNDLDETGFEIERSTDNATFTRVGTAPPWQLAGWSKTVVPPQAPPSFTDTSASPSTTYHYRVRSLTPRGASRYSTAVAATTPAPPPTGWQSLDIGDTSLTGTATRSGDVFTIRGAGSGVGSVRYYRESSGRGDYGANVTGYSDEFQYCWQPWTGDGEMVARVTSFSGSTGHAGIMLRLGTGASAYNVFCHVTPMGGTGVTARGGDWYVMMQEYRNETRSFYSSTDTPPPPTWLKIVRTSSGVMCYSSRDGSAWTEIAWIPTSGWPADAQFGFAVSSQQDGAPPALPGLLATTFDNVAIRSISAPVPPPQPPTNLRATQTVQTWVTLAWDPPSAAYTGFDLQRSRDGVNFIFIANNTNSTGQVDNTVDAATTYYYRVRSLRSGTLSAWSPLLTVRTPDYPSAPTNLTATPLSSTDVRLSWTDTSSTEAGFTISRSTDGTMFSHYVSVGADITTYAAFGLTPGVTYYFYVHANPTRPGPLETSNVVSVTPGGTPSPASPDNLTASAVSPTRVDLSWADNSSNETAFQLERSLNGTSFSLLATLPANTRQYSDTSVNGQTTYHYRVRATLDGSAPSAYSNVAQTTTPSTPPTGDVWQSRDIGAVAAAGSASESGGVVTIRASGADIWNQADEFHFRFQPWSGDGTITARLTGLTDTNGWAKAGVMFRESLTADAQHAMMIVSVAHGSAVQYRTGTGTESLSSAPSGNSTLPRFVRLTRVGNSIAGYESFDGGTWYFVYSVTFASLPPTMYVGLAATSHNDGVFTTATFDQVNVTSPGTPGGLPAPSQFTAAAISSTQIELAWTDNSSDETGFVIESSTDGSSYSHLVTVGPNVRAVSNAGLAPSTTYYYRLYAQRGDTRSTTVTASATTHPITPPPSGEWQSRDIGTTTAGSTSGSGSAVTLTGSGRDIWNTADGFRYYYRQSSASDSDFIVRVASLQNTNGWAKAGIMFRESLDPGSPFLSMIVSAEHGVAFQYRGTPGLECASSAPTEDGSAPRWLKMSRRGVTFYGYVSSDGVNWTQVLGLSNSRITSDQNWYVGLAVTSHNDGVLCTAAFDNVSFSEGLPGSTPPSPPTGLTATAASSSQVNLAWSDASNNEAGFEVERSTDGTNFNRVTTTAANAVTHADSGLSASTTYYYRVRAVNSAGASAYTPIVTATTPAVTAPPPGAWQSNDVGAVAAAGSASESGTTVTLRGSGADIWNTADEFHFRSMPWTGDGEIVTRVTTLTDTNGWAKAGLMFRENLTANARHAFMCVSIAHGTAFQYRTTTGGESGSSPPSESGGVPRWLRLVRSGNTFTGYASADGTNWTNAGSITLALPATIYVGQVVTSHNDGVLCTATFEGTSVGNGGTPPPPPPPPPPTTSWEFRDIGAVGIAGSNTSDANTITVHASGADVWGTADGFRFVYRALSGDGTVEAQVSSLEPTHAWAKAGVMIRESLSANAPNVFAFVTPSNGVVAQHRAAGGGTTIATAGPWWVQAPYWVRLVRAGSRITAFSSPDGTNWTQFAAYDVSMGTTTYVGFAVTSHDNSQLATAVFTDPFVQ